MNMSSTYLSACPLNCWDNCGLKVTIDDGKIVKVDGNKDHPITKGMICGRGRMQKDRTHSEERLTTPLKKINGKFQEISWEEALDEIAEKMLHYKNAYGSISILHSHDYANSGLLKNLDQRFFNCFGGVTELVGSVCWGSGIEAQKWDFGAVYSHHPDDIFNSKHIIVWGRNAARTNLHFYHQLLKAKKLGIHVTVIDPIFNETAKIADRYVSIKPGMDGLLAIGIMKVIFAKGLQHQKFIDDHMVGKEELYSLLNSLTIDEISEITEVPKKVITELALQYGDGPTSTYLGLGMQRYKNGGNTIRLIDALVAISGNIGISGGGVNYANQQVTPQLNFTSLLLEERKENSRYFTMMEQGKEVLEQSDPPIKMIFVTCGNPLTQLPNTNEVWKAFSSVDTLVVVDQFMTDTAKLADYILPTTTSFEEEDIYYSSMFYPYLNYGPKLVCPPGEAKSDLWIWTELANRLGFGKEFSYTREEWLEMALLPLKDKGITFQTIKEQGYVKLPVEEIPWKDWVFQTPSGKFEFVSNMALQKGFPAAPTISFPRESKWSNPILSEKYPYQLLTIHPLRSNHSQHYFLLDPTPKVTIEVSKNIAENLQLKTGDYVKVWNDRGEIYGYVKLLKDESHRNMIKIDEGYSRELGGPVNLLTSSEPSDNRLGSTIYDCLVNIIKVEEVKSF